MAVDQNSPIIFITLDNSMNAQAVTNAYLESVEQSSPSAYPVYRVVDLRDADTAFANHVSTIRELVRGMAGAAIYPDMWIAFVGKPHMEQPFANLNLPFFASQEAALDYAHTRLADSLISA
jgi:hypothetical protein